ncbi:MAG TPA: hypothetical protein VFS00_12410, partial [Polyangiaceae bacterium]|nr:hypothetical protein [Polyangiaceae bacterium]
MSSRVVAIFLALAGAASVASAAGPAQAAPPTLPAPLASPTLPAPPASAAPGPRADLAAELLDAESAFTLDDPWEPLFDWLVAVGSVTAFGLAADSLGRDGFGTSTWRWGLLGVRVGGLRTISRAVHRPGLARACVQRAERVAICAREAAERGYTLRYARRVFSGAGALVGALGYGLTGGESLLLPTAASGVSVILDFFPTKSER